MSHGMICSEKELGIGEDESGILVLPEEAEVGCNLAKALFLDDVVLDISIYANRPDCMSMLGIAREVAALTGGKLRYPDLDYAAIPARAADHLRVEVLDTKYCPRYTALMVQRVKVGQSPLWMHAAAQPLECGLSTMLWTLQTMSCWNWASHCMPLTTPN